MQAFTPKTIAANPAIAWTECHPLHAFFAPKTVAVIGATERPQHVGRTVLWNLISHPFGGTVFPVNPQRAHVLGIKAYPTIAAVPEAVDLAIVVTPAPTVPDIIGECVAANVKAAIVLSANFRETGLGGAELEQAIRQQAQRGKLRILGPNCLGLMNPRTGLNASFASAIARPGNVGFISQSGALCTAILDWSIRENVGFSAFISIGNMLDVDWGDLIYYLGEDPGTQSIVLCMESIGDARSFLSAAREVALTKPIIVMKAGRMDASAQAATSHTGILTGSDAVLDAAFRRCGVLRVSSISDLFDMAEVLAKQPRPRGPRLTILTNAGGPGVIAADALLAAQGELASLSPQTYDALNQLLPDYWSHTNPIDILGDADADRYAKALTIAAAEPNSDGLLVILAPQAVTEPTQTAAQLEPYARSGKPILASWMGGATVDAGIQVLNQLNIPTVLYPDTAARLFNYMWRYSYNLRGIYETPSLAAVSEQAIANQVEVEQLIQRVRQANRTLLTEVESKQILAAYGIPTVETHLATSEAEAVQLAEAIGYPVVLKLHSQTVTHKAAVGGVTLNLCHADAVRVAYRAIVERAACTDLSEDALSDQRQQESERALRQSFSGVTVQPMVSTDGYELIIGSSVDTQFGPVLLFGVGGRLVEVVQDQAIALPPLTTTLARRLIEQTQIYHALMGEHNQLGVNMAALEQVLVRFSHLVAEQRWIKEIDINPLHILRQPSQASSNGPQALLTLEDSVLALDARMVLHDTQTTEAQLPKLAVRPYPSHYVTTWALPDGSPVIIRPIRPEDEPLMVQFHQTLSDESIYFRYFHMVGLRQRIAHDRLARICFIDYDRELALVVDRGDPQTGAHEILGVARLSKLHGSNEAEFAMLISDRVQHQGLGTELLKRLVQIARSEQLERLTADILAENRSMQRVCEKLGFQIVAGDDPSIVRVVRAL